MPLLTLARANELSAPPISVGGILQYGCRSFIQPNLKCRLRTNPHNADTNYSYLLSGYFGIRNAFSSVSSSHNCNTAQHLPSLSIVMAFPNCDSNSVVRLTLNVLLCFRLHLGPNVGSTALVFSWFTSVSQHLKLGHDNFVPYPS
jgi:hypothetical protein